MIHKISLVVVIQLVECTVHDAFVNVDDWTTDWVCRFTVEEEQQFARENIETFKQLYDGRQ